MLLLLRGHLFGCLEVPGGGPPLEIGGVDIADAFYHIGLEEELQEYFSLAPVQAQDVGVTSIGGQSDNLPLLVRGPDGLDFSFVDLSAGLSAGS